MKRIILISCFLTLFFISCNNAGKTYQMDMFSIVSFGLAIASILLSAFMGWLSWELYKKSTDASDKTQQAVIRIESSVLGIRNDITEIVKRAVGFWIDGAANEDEIGNKDSVLDAKFVELGSKISEITGKIQDPKVTDLDKEIKDILNEHKQEINRLNTSLFDAKVKSIFPSATTSSALTFIQSTSINTENENRGQLYIHINRPVKIATASGKFNPNLNGHTLLTAKLVSAPYTNLDEVILTSGIGQYSDFHIHLRTPNTILIAGDYIVEYSAMIN